MNIFIYGKQGHLVGKLDKAPMTDFSSATIITTGSLPPGNHTLYSPQYVVTAKHVSGSDTMSFGYAKNTYTTVGTNNNSGLDIKTRRLSKLVTEVAPAEVSDVGGCERCLSGRRTLYCILSPWGGDAVRQRQKW